MGGGEGVVKTEQTVFQLFFPLDGPGRRALMGEESRVGAVLLPECLPLIHSTDIRLTWNFSAYFSREGG